MAVSSSHLRGGEGPRGREGFSEKATSKKPRFLQELLWDFLNDSLNPGKELSISTLVGIEKPMKHQWILLGPCYLVVMYDSKR